MKKLNVIMAVYNAEKYLGEAVSSILEQSFDDFLLLCMYEKTSNDASLEILNSFSAQDSRVKIIPNDGFEKSLIDSLNQGLSMSNSEYIARMDSDDICDRNRFRIELDFLENNKDIDVVGSCVDIIGDLTDKEYNEHIRRFNVPMNCDNAREVMLTYWYCFLNSSTMFRRTVVDSIGFYNQTRAEDFDFWLRCLRNGHKIHKLDKKLVAYRVHEESMLQQAILDKTAASTGFQTKLDDVFLGKNTKKTTYVIWGAGTGGEVTKKVLDDKGECFVCKGFIDTYKTGVFLGYDICKPEELEAIDYDYLFIATVPGKDAAIEKLKKSGKENIRDFLCSV